MKNPSRPRLGGVLHAPSQKTSDAEIPPRMDCLPQIAIGDWRWQLAIDLKRFHNTSPNGPRLYHMICADVTRKKCGAANVWPWGIITCRGQYPHRYRPR